ncbi:establishment of cohesion [Aphomia sociella]
MATITPRRSQRLPHTHTPKMSERKKGLFQSSSEPVKESLTEHRRLPVVDSESDSEDCDLGIISTLDSSSDENDGPKTPERNIWHETRSQTRKLLIENKDLKNFIKSPFTLKKYQTRYSCGDLKCTGSMSTPATPHFHNHPGTPSSTHSCASVYTNSSTSSRARKSLANLIADTESCSSSLKDLNFDTDSGTDSKENTPTKSGRRSSRKQKMTPKVQTFKGVLLEQKKNMLSPMKTAVVCLTKMDMTNMMSPTQMLKTPHNTTEAQSPPKIGHSRRSVVEINESPESICDDSEKSNKRLRNDSISDSGPHSKYPRLDVPKARTSLFNSDRLKEILSTKSFYGKSNPELNSNVAIKISNAIEITSTHNRRPFSNSLSHRRKRKPGQINMGVKHKIRKPKVNKAKMMSGIRPLNTSMDTSVMNSTVSNVSNNDSSMLSQNSSQELGNDKADPFVNEKQTIEALLSQWTEEEVPESELSYSKPRQELPCFNSAIIEETNQIFQPVTAVPVSVPNIPHDSEAVIVELGSKNEVVLPQNATLIENLDIPHNAATPDVVMSEPDGHKANHGDLSKSGLFLPVEGGYLLVDDQQQGQDELPDLDEIERELKMLDEQILKVAHSNNINPQAVLASTETVMPAVVTSTSVDEATKENKPQKLFSIFSNPNPGTSTPTSSAKASDKNKKCLLKNGSDQYVIDAGQKQFGATQCTECGVIYQVGDPQDEHDHYVHHNATDVLRFNGWKEECVVGRYGDARCVQVRAAAPGWRRVRALLARLLHPQLGLPAALPAARAHTYTAYLYIEKKQISGCLIVEPKTKAHKMIPGDPDCCSEEEYPVKCGVSRVWTHPACRRRGVAARLLDCARARTLVGAALERSEIAFSAPTPAGARLAAAYCGTPNFYVYLE